MLLFVLIALPCLPIPPSLNVCLICHHCLCKNMVKQSSLLLILLCIPKSTHRIQKEVSSISATCLRIQEFSIGHWSILYYSHFIQSNISKIHILTFPSKQFSIQKEYQYFFVYFFRLFFVSEECLLNCIQRKSTLNSTFFPPNFNKQNAKQFSVFCLNSLKAAY